MILLTHTQTLEVVLAAAPATTQPTYVTGWVDEDATTFALGAVGSTDGLTNSTIPVTVAAAPASGSVRRVSGLSLYNSDTVSVIATVQVNDNGTIRTMWNGLVQDGDSLLYDDQRGFYVIDSNGELRVNITNVGASGSSGSSVPPHATTHEAGGDDPIPLDTLAAPSDTTTLNASTSKHGLMPKFDGTASHYVKGDGTQGAISVGDVPTLNQNTTGSAAKLTTARTIAGVSFDGTANIAIPATGLSDYAAGTWSPSDVSGAGLSLTVTSATYVKIGKLVWVQAYVTYPATANGSQAQIGGLPYVVENFGAPAWSSNSPTTILSAQALASSQTGFYPIGVGVISNATLSTYYVIFSLVYRTT